MRTASRIPTRPASVAHSDEVADHHQPDPHAGLGRAEPVAAHRDRVDAPARERQHELQERRRSRAPRSAPSRCRHRRFSRTCRRAASEVPGVATGAACEITSVRPSSVNSIPNVATNEEMPTTAMKNPLTKPISRAAEQRDDHRRHERQADVDELVEEERRDQVDGADREVDLAVDHDEDLARREDRDRREVRQQRLEVAARREVFGGHREVDERRDRDDDDAALAQASGSAQRASCALAPRVPPAAGGTPGRSLCRGFASGRDSHDSSATRSDDARLRGGALEATLGASRTA